MDNHIQDLKRNEYKNAHSVYMTQNIQLQVYYAPPPTCGRRTYQMVGADFKYEVEHSVLCHDAKLGYLTQ